MTRFVAFLGRKSQAGKSPEQPTDGSAAPNDLELDNELFMPLATQLGEETEAIRILLVDAEHKIGELENVKRSIGGLVEPVNKTLRAYEQIKNEKLGLQGVLNATRVAYNKLREDMSTVEKRAATLETECNRLRELSTVVQQAAAALERSKTENLSELNSRRAQIAELQRQLQQQSSELQSARDEHRRLAERFGAADKSMVQLENRAQTAEQKAKQANNERVAVQAALDKALNDYSQTARKLTETDKVLTVTQARLKTAETSLAEAQAERTRLSAALDEARHKHLEESSQQSARFEALQARATLTENLLEEARQTLMARSDEIRTLERRVAESADANGTAGEQLAQLTASLAEREQLIKEFEQAHTKLNEQNQTLISAVTAREAAYGRAIQKLKEQDEHAAQLDGQIKAAREDTDLQIEQLKVQIQRERIDRAMAEGSLESSRKDIARLMRELTAARQRTVTAPQAANTEEAPEGLRSAA